LEKNIELYIETSTKKKKNYGVFGISLLLLSTIIIIISLLILWNFLFFIALIFIIISVCLTFVGILLIIGSLSNFINIDGESIIFRNYFKKKTYKLNDIYKINYELPLDVSENFLPMNKLVIHSKEGTSKINLRYYDNRQKIKIEQVIDDIIKVYLDI
jgi:hypothetical protein